MMLGKSCWSGNRGALAEEINSTLKTLGMDLKYSAAQIVEFLRFIFDAHTRFVRTPNVRKNIFHLMSLTIESDGSVTITNNFNGNAELVVQFQDLISFFDIYQRTNCTHGLLSKLLLENEIPIYRYKNEKDIDPQRECIRAFDEKYYPLRRYPKGYCDWGLDSYHHPGNPERFSFSDYNFDNFQRDLNKKLGGIYYIYSNFAIRHSDYEKLKTALCLIDAHSSMLNRVTVLSDKTDDVLNDLSVLCGFAGQRVFRNGYLPLTTPKVSDFIDCHLSKLIYIWKNFKGEDIFNLFEQAIKKDLPITNMAKNLIHSRVNRELACSQSLRDKYPYLVSFAETALNNPESNEVIEAEIIKNHKNGNPENDAIIERWGLRVLKGMKDAEETRPTYKALTNKVLRHPHIPAFITTLAESTVETKLKRTKIIKKWPSL